MLLLPLLYRMMWDGRNFGVLGLGNSGVGFVGAVQKLSNNHKILFISYCIHSNLGKNLPPVFTASTVFYCTSSSVNV
jgi:hypothetical protein